MSTGSPPPPIPVPQARLAAGKDDRKVMRDFPMENLPPAIWDTDTRAAAVHYAGKDNAHVRRLLFIHRGTLAIAYAVTSDEPIPGAPDTPACYLAVMGILPGYRGAELTDGRRLSHVVLDTQIDDGRHWGRPVMHTIVHDDNARMRSLLISRGFQDIEPLGDGWTRMAAEY